jgi:tetratricopeptide (TPR) repeat protein
MMKNTKWFAIAGFAVLSATVSAQKTNETSAAVEFRNTYKDKLMRQDFDGAKKSLEKAKGFIDQAAAHPDTKDSPKTLFLKGEIYSNFVMLGMQSMDTTFIKKGGEDALDVAIASYKRGYEVSDKFDGEIEDAVNEKKMIINQMSTMLFNNKNYSEAIELYDLQAQLSSALNQVDTGAIFNAGISAENAGDYNRAADYYKRLSEMGYRVPDIYKMAANALIQAKKNEEATTFLAKAIEKQPNDKTLYYVIGTFYMEAGDNEKATQNLTKAVELDPKYYEAQYQLGAHYLTIASDKRKTAGMMDLKQIKQAQALEAEALEYYKKAAGPLEIYVSANPKDAAVLTSLFQIYRALEDNTKAAEYKKRADEAQK